MAGDLKSGMVFRKKNNPKKNLNNKSDDSESISEDIARRTRDVYKIIIKLTQDGAYLVTCKNTANKSNK